MPDIKADVSRRVPLACPTRLLKDDEVHSADGDFLFLVTDQVVQADAVSLIATWNGETRWLSACTVYEALAHGDLKVRRNLMPFVPPELEVDPQIRFDEDGYF